MTIQKKLDRLAILFNTTQKKLDRLAILFNTTKNPRYKRLWYKLIERTYGSNNSQRWDISSYPHNKKNIRWNSVDKRN
jgi:hypothetical protein